MIPAADVERAVGIECYATAGEPCGARAKSAPGDFVVEEQADLGQVSAAEKPGYYPLYRVEKSSIDTLHMASELSDVLKSRVSYGGMKDKKAAAIQYATPTSLRSERPKQVTRERFTASLVGFVPRPIHRGAVSGNRFSITLRGCCPRVEERIGETLRIGSERRLPNFYGLQRFGSLGAGTHEVGKALVKQDFKGAVDLMLFRRRHSDDWRVRAAVEAMNSGRYGEGGRLLPEGMDVEKRIAHELDRHPGEPLQALRAVPIRLRRLYVQAFQSALFNRSLSRALAAGEDISSVRQGDNWADAPGDGLVTSRAMGVKDQMTSDAVPMMQIAGYAFRDYGSRFDAYAKAVMEEEGVAPKEFYVKEMQEVSAEGGFRRPHVAMVGASWRVDGGNATLRFTLGRGQYATVVLREVIKPRDPAASGLA